MAKILVVEDEKKLASAYRMILESHGHTVSLAYDGQEALDSVKRAAPDLVLLDMMMPKVDGLEFLRQLEDTAPGTRVVVFSNQDSQLDIDEAFRLGAKRYLLKAWASPQDLVKVVKEALND